MKQTFRLFVAIAVGVILVSTWTFISSSKLGYSVSSNVFSSILGGNAPPYHEVSSVSTANGRYFNIDFGDQHVMNPNIIPHPFLENTWIVTAQFVRDAGDNQPFAELSCNAIFVNDTLKCISHPVALPIAPTQGDKCVGDASYLGLSRGPHDARVFYGPHHPYTIFGSNSEFTCFGQWIQDFRMLVEWGYEAIDREMFQFATEMQRPPPYGVMEKNWFLFFNQQDEPYIHYDIAPQRAFAKVDNTGAVGSDLAFWSAEHDTKCMAKWMPKIGPELESLHQSTNSLLITMCRRNDPECEPNNSNTFVFTIFQHKTYYYYHALYEPYIMLFEQQIPFKLHAISKRPFWVSGRKGNRLRSPGRTPTKPPPRHEDVQEEEMLYVVSVSWKEQSQKYHGYIDDVMFIAFGIEDERAAAIDVTADQLLGDLGMC